MRKEINPRELCSKCGHVTKYEEYEEFCDQCGTLIPDNVYPLKLERYDIDGEDNNHEDVHLCSWKCVMNYLQTNKQKLLKDGFFTLPYITKPDRHNRKDCAEDAKKFFQVFVPNTKKVESDSS